MVLPSGRLPSAPHNAVACFPEAVVNVLVVVSVEGVGPVKFTGTSQGSPFSSGVASYPSVGPVKKPLAPRTPARLFVMLLMGSLRIFKTKQLMRLLVFS